MSYGGFGFDFNNLNLPTLSFGPDIYSGTSSGQQTTTATANVPWYQVALTSGLDGFKSWLNFDLAQQQVAAGQRPSQNATFGSLFNGGVQTGGSSLLFYLVIAFIVLMLFRR